MAPVLELNNVSEWVGVLSTCQQGNNSKLLEIGVDQIVCVSASIRREILADVPNIIAHWDKCLGIISVEEMARRNGLF